MKLVRIQGQPSWRFASDKVEAAVTCLGGHLAPVKFHLPRKTIQPYSIAPWAEEPPARGVPNVLNILRGDFFCAPFGAGAPYRGEDHPAHGESANRTWKFESLSEDRHQTTLHLSMATKIRQGTVDKYISLRRGQTALYCRHVLSEMTGPMNFGHHATLKFPEEPGSGYISTSRILHGETLPVPFEKPEEGGYSSLKTKSSFTKLTSIPKTDGTTADLTRYPARRGFEDLVMFAHESSPDFAWMAAAFPKEGYVWFALKDPRVLRSTILWITNGGRHYSPWNGRHVNVMGLEDVTSYFHYGLAASAKANSFSKRGLPTTLLLEAKKPLFVNYIMGVAPIPASWNHIRSIKKTDRGIVLSGPGRAEIKVPIDTSFLYENQS